MGYGAIAPVSGGTGGFKVVDGAVQGLTVGIWCGSGIKTNERICDAIRHYTLEIQSHGTVKPMCIRTTASLFIPLYAHKIHNIVDTSLCTGHISLRNKSLLGNLLPLKGFIKVRYISRES